MVSRNSSRIWHHVAIARLTQDRSGGLGRFVNRLFSRELLFPTVVVGVLTFLVVPWDEAGAIVAAMLTGLFLCMLFLVQRFLKDGRGARFPLWQMSLAVGLTAIVLTGAPGVGVPGTPPRSDRLPR